MRYMGEGPEPRVYVNFERSPADGSLMLHLVHRGGIILSKLHLTEADQERIDKDPEWRDMYAQHDHERISQYLFPAAYPPIPRR